MPMDSPASARFGGRRVPAFNRLDSADLVGRREDQAVAHLERARLDPARQDAPVVEAVNVLDGQAQGLVGAAARPG